MTIRTFLLTPILTLIAFLTVFGCGKHHNLQPLGDDNTLPLILRGQWQYRITSDGNSIREVFDEQTNASQPISTTVMPLVTFTVSNTNFLNPTPAIDTLTSYGTLDVTALRDNNLRVCGTSGKDKCVTGIIRTYSTGTSGPGVWNELDQYGAPISTNGNSILLGAAGAFNVSTFSIGNKKILNLQDFSSGGALKIPFDVDYQQAPAGSYTTTLVIEYLLQ